jgi:ABC-type uncharacterized transport system involved in gliding motility auxiliary subunit
MKPQMKGLHLLLSSVNLLIALILLGVLFIMVNYLSSRHYARWDLTQQKMTALSEKTVQTLKAIEEPLAVIVFYQPTHRLFELIKDELKEYERTSQKIEVEYVDPEQDIARAKQLAQQFQIEDLNLVVFQAGSRHKYLSDTELAEYDYGPMQLGGQPRVKAFKGEEAFTSAIISVTQAEAPLVWFTSGHGETSMEAQEPGGLSDLKKYLEQQNMSVQTVTLLEHASILSNVKLVVIAGPTRRFTEAEVALLHIYLEQGGRLLALIDPLNDSGLDALLERWGITLGMDIVVDPARQLPFVSAANLFVLTYTQHPIVEKMKTLVTLYPLARSVRSSQPVPEGVTVTPLALTSEAGWGETQTSIETFQFNEGQDLKGPVSIAVASERLPAPPSLAQAGTSPTRTRLVVIGDSDFIVNAQLGNAGNRDMLLGSIYWLTEQEQLIGIGPKPLESIKLNLTGTQLTGLFWFSLLAMPFACGLLGVGMWFLRRQ